MSGDRIDATGAKRIVWTRRRALRYGAAGIGMLAFWECAPPVALKIPTVGFVSPVADDLALFMRPFRAIGYVEGQNITIESRTAVQAETPEQLRPAVEELLRLPADVIVAIGSTAAQAAKGATTTIPVVFFGVADAIALGLVMSLARPEGNVTGVTNFSASAIGKGLEFLLQIVPGVTRVAFVGNLGGNPGALLQLAAAKTTAATLGVQVSDFALRDAADIDSVFELLYTGGFKAVMVGSDAITANISNRQHLVELSARYRLPTIYARRELVDAGGLIAYGPSYPALWERLAVFVDKIVRGALPGNIPVEQPTRLDLVVNKKTARTLGITIPQPILVQATEVVDR